MCLLPPLHSLHAVREEMRGRWETYRIRSNTFLGYYLPLAFFFLVCFSLFIIARPSGTFYQLCPNSADFLNVQLVLLPAPKKTAQEGSFPRSLKCNVWGALSMGMFIAWKDPHLFLCQWEKERRKKKKQNFARCFTVLLFVLACESLTNTEMLLTQPEYCCVTSLLKRRSPSEP